MIQQPAGKWQVVGMTEGAIERRERVLGAWFGRIAVVDVGAVRDECLGDRAHVVGRAHEADRHQVHAVLEAEGQVFEQWLRERAPAATDEITKRIDDIRITTGERDPRATEGKRNAIAVATSVAVGQERSGDCAAARSSASVSMR